MPHPTTACTRSERRTRFTLVELLVVISIIAVLASMLMPALAKSKETSRRAVCKSNLRQYSVAFTLYCDEADDYFPVPYWTAWYQVFPYLGITKDAAGKWVDPQGLLLCPTDSTPAPVGSGHPGDRINISYGWNYALPGWPRRAGVPKDLITQIPMLADSGNKVPSSYGLISPWGSTNGYLCSARHAGGSEVLFCDQSVRWYRYEDLTYFQNGIPRFWRGW
ncbi:MAG: hypothetical protein A3K19_00810 [Lentisphaerae bacterium RIFOXYB12_FULL_65_16]|nr:MAG: hypothetical protein A3K18_14325 [Lentisphaerae bacterium RIFOXYA12_64_32]OGV86761.1 MAG: hypothetical protein A3K19_00810 [Lentisphaerae bacterium RIFOXYB12_FULL_65_16]